MRERFQREPPGFAGTVRILLRNAGKRAAGQGRRQRELLRQRTGRPSKKSRGALGTGLALFLTALLHGAAAFFLFGAVGAGERVELASHGKLMVRQVFLDRVESVISNGMYGANGVNSAYFDQLVAWEARSTVRDYGGSQEGTATGLRDSVRAHGTHNLVPWEDWAGLKALTENGRYPAMLGSLVLFLWSISLICQGEGPELDVQRRRHPMWEWLMSHPVAPAAVFTAEMFAPVAASPIYWTAPLFPGILYGILYGPWLGLLAVFLVGIPVTLSAAFLGKSLEIAIMLRFPPRSRGAIMGLVGWWAYASTIVLFLGAGSVGKFAGAVAFFLAPLTALPWPWLGFF